MVYGEAGLRHGSKIYRASARFAVPVAEFIRRLRGDAELRHNPEALVDPLDTDRRS
jgi:hypothetical protein